MSYKTLFGTHFLQIFLKKKTISVDQKLLNEPKKGLEYQRGTFLVFFCPRHGRVILTPTRQVFFYPNVKIPRGLEEITYHTPPPWGVIQPHKMNQHLIMKVFTHGQNSQWITRY